MKCQNQVLILLQFQINLLWFMCALFYSSFVCVSAYANVYFKTTIIKQNITIILIAGVPSSQALLGFLITAPPSMCVPAVLRALAVWIQKPIFFFKPLHVLCIMARCGSPLMFATTVFVKLSMCVMAITYTRTTKARRVGIVRSVLAPRMLSSSCFMP